MREVRGRREEVEVQRDLVDPEMDAPALIGLLGMINKGMKYIVFVFVCFSNESSA